MSESPNSAGSPTTQSAPSTAPDGLPTPPIITSETTVSEE